jgi:hypothetical protein
MELHKTEVIACPAFLSESSPKSKVYLGSTEKEGV